MHGSWNAQSYEFLLIHREILFILFLEREPFFLIFFLTIYEVNEKSIVWKE